MDVEGTQTIGRKILVIRLARGISLRVAAGLAGMNKNTLWRIERNKRDITMMELVAIADALRISPSELMRLPVPAPTNGDTDSAIEAIRRAMEAVSQGCPGGETLTAGVLTARVDEVTQARRDCELNAAGAPLASLIRDLHTSILAGRDVPELLTLATITHSLVVEAWLRDAGAPSDLRRQATALARQAASERGEPSAIAIAAYGTVYALISGGMIELAADRLAALAVPSVTPDTAGLVGELMLAHALLAAMRGRPGDVAEPLRVASELGERFGEPTRLWDACGFAFGPTDVNLYRMDLALEAGDPEGALRVAASFDPRAHPWVTRQAAYWVWRAQAFSRVRGRREHAVMALRRAEIVSPHHVHRNPFSRDVLATLLTASRDDAVGRELRGMAFRSGVQPQ